MLVVSVSQGRCPPKSVLTSSQGPLLPALTQIDNLNLFVAGGNAIVTLSELEVAAIQSNHTYVKQYRTDCQPWC